MNITEKQKTYLDFLNLMRSMHEQIADYLNSHEVDDMRSAELSALQAGLATMFRDFY